MSAKLWTKDYILASFVSLCIYLTFYSTMVVVALYSMQQLHGSSSQSGLAAGGFLLTALLARLITGHYIEFFGKRRMLLLGTILFALGTLLYFISADIYLLIAFRLLHGLSFGVCATAISTVTANILPFSRQSEGMGYFLLSITLASALGPWFGMYIYETYGFAALSTINFLLCLAGIAAVWPINLPSTANAAVKVSSRLLGLNSYIEICILPMAGISFVIYLCYSSIISFFSAYAASINMLQAGQYFFLIYSLTIIISRPFVGHLADTHGCNCVIYPSLLSFSLGLLLLSCLHTAAMMVLSAVLLGFGFGTFAAIIQVIAIQKVPQQRIGIALSTLLSICELGTGAGPSLIGLLLSFLSFSAVYELMAAIAALAFLAYWLSVRHHLI